MNKGSKKGIVFKQDMNISAFICDIRIGLEDMTEQNKGVFGDEAKLYKLNKINKLEEWEKNLLFMYVYFGSLYKMQEYTNVSYCTLSNTVKTIIQKLNE